MPVPSVDVGQVLLVRVYNQLFSQIAINTMHFRVQETTGTPTVTDVAAHFDNALAPLYKQVMPAQANYLGIGVTIVLPTPRSIEFLSNLEPGVGTASGSPMPSQCCGVISCSTNLAGPKNRGRIYIPFPATSFASTDESPSTAYYGFLGLICDETDQVSIVSGGDEIELKRIIYPGPGTTLWDVERVVPKDKWGTQRRRGDYGALNQSPF